MLPSRKSSFLLFLFFCLFVCLLLLFHLEFSHGKPETISPRKASCDSPATQPYLITSLVYAAFLCDHITGCEAYSFTTDGYGIFNVSTKLMWVRAVHERLSGASCRYWGGGVFFYQTFEFNVIIISVSSDH